MIRFILVALWVSSSIAMAQIPEKWFVAALARSDGFAIAFGEAQNAKVRLQRLKSDPLATKPLWLESSTALELAEARVVATRLEVRRSLFQNIFAWRNALDTFETASAKLNLADASAKATNARFKVGAVTSVEVNRTEAELRATQSEISSARSELAATVEVLQNQLGFAPNAITPSQALPRPTRQVLERNLDSSVRIVDAKGALARAKLDFEIKDNEFSAPVEISEAKRNVSNAERNLADARNGVKAALTTRWEVYQSAAGALTARERAVQLATDELKTQVERLARGLVSQLVILQARVALVQAQSNLEFSHQRLATSVLELAILVNLDLWR